MGRHQDRTGLGREFGATDVVSERGEEGIARVRDLTGGHGTHVVIEAVGYMPAYEQPYGVVRPGGRISRVGVPQYEEAPVGFGSLFAHNITLAGGPAPVRAYVEELLPDVLDGKIEPGEEHWHGASATRFMTHIAIQEAVDPGSPVTWLEHVTHEEYAAAPSIDKTQQ